MTRTTVVAGNWKMNPPREGGEALFREVLTGLGERSLPASVEAAIFPPAPYLGSFGSLAGDALRLGAQDVAAESWGAYTGALGAELLRGFGCHYGLIGHSERRHHFGDTDAQCQRKLEAARAGGLVPMLCVGETEAERDAGETFDVVRRQIDAGLAEQNASHPVVIAYEPVWAIGTGRTATPEMAAEVHRYVRNALQEKWGADFAARTPILYGGSVKPDNASALLSDPDIDGALIGGASLEAASFLAILDAALAGSRG